MKTCISVLLLTLTFPLAGWAGILINAASAPSAPAMGEGGLVMLAIALAGTGVALLRGRKR